MYDNLLDKTRIQDVLEKAVQMQIKEVFFSEAGIPPSGFRGQLSYVPVHRFTFPLGGTMQLYLIRQGNWQQLTLEPGQIICFTPNSFVSCNASLIDEAFGVVLYPKYLRLIYSFKQSQHYYHTQNFRQATASAIITLGEMAGFNDCYNVTPRLVKIILELILEDLNHAPIDSGVAGALYTFVQIEQFISLNQLNNIDRVTVARHFKLSECYISKLFKRFGNNETFNDYLIRLRLENAARMLLQTNMAVAEIAYHCMYNGISHFIRQFRRKFNMSPGEYRRNHLRQ